MLTATYQVVFDKYIELKTHLESALKETFDSIYVEFDEENFEFIEIKYQVTIDDHKSLAGFQLSLDNLDADYLKIISSFNEKLKDAENLAIAFKFYDNTLYELLIKLYQELFDIEMRLRETITLIFVDTYKDDFYNLLHEVDVPVQLGLNKQLYKNKDDREIFLSKRLENEFFHILFSDYVKLTKPKTLKQDDLFLIAEISNNFDEFRDKILKRGVTKEKYVDFINSIKENMNNLEKVRNCVAHSRTPSDDELYNYNLSKEDILQKIDAFVEELTKTEE